MSFIETSDVIKTYLCKFVTVLESTYGIKVPDRAWIGGCQTILKSGARAGQLCGKALKTGGTACAAHSRGGSTPAPVTGVSPVKPGVKEQACFRRSACGNFVCDGLVIDRATKGVYGREEKDGTIVPLTADDRKRCVALNLQITDKGVAPLVPPIVVAVPEPKEEVTTHDENNLQL